MSRLKNIWRRIVSLSLFAAVLCLPFCSVTYAETITQTGLNLTPGQSTMLLTTLQTQEKALEEALTLLEEAEMELNESESQLSLSTEELQKAKSELKKQQEELTLVRSQLEEQQKELDLASKSIRNANIYLEQAAREMLENDKKHQAREKRLRGERTLWQIISIALCGVCVAT